MHILSLISVILHGAASHPAHHHVLSPPLTSPPVRTRCDVFVHFIHARLVPTNARERRPMIQPTAHGLRRPGPSIRPNPSIPSNPPRPRSIQPVLSLPPRKIRRRVLGPRLGLVLAICPGHIPRHKRRELRSRHRRQQPVPCPSRPVLPLSRLPHARR